MPPSAAPSIASNLKPLLEAKETKVSVKDIVDHVEEKEGRGELVATPVYSMFNQIYRFRHLYQTI